MYSPPTNYTAPGDGVTLQQIIVIHRHGDRAPISPSAGTVVLDGEMWEPRLPTAEEQKAWDEMHPVSGPSKAVDIDIAPFGQLTKVGAAQCEVLGAAIRESLREYAPHLLPSGAASEISAHSTNIRRTQQSVQNVLNGLGAPSTPIIVRSIEDERLIPRGATCPALRRRIDSMRAGIKARAASVPSEHAVLQLTERSMGYEADGLRLDQAREVLVCALTHGDPLPTGLTEEEVLSLLSINAVQWDTLYSDRVVGKLGMGRLVHEILSEWLEPAAASSDAIVEGGVPKIVLLSGHDSTLIPFLSALDLFHDKRWPAYASHIRIELGTLDGGVGGEKMLARILFQGRPLHIPSVRVADVGDTTAGWVPWPSLKALLQEVALTDAEYGKACAEGGGGAGEDESMQDTLVGKKKGLPSMTGTRF